MKRTSTGNQGFTLIEIMIVVAVIALLASLLIPAVMGTRTAYDKTAAQDLVNGLVMALKIQKVEDGRYPLPDNQESTDKTDPGYYKGQFVYDRSDENPGLVNRLVTTQKFGFDAGRMLSEDNVLIDGWNNPIHYVLGDAKNSKNLASHDPDLPQDLNKPKDADSPPADSDWNTGDEAGYPYIYSEGPDPARGEESWIYPKD